MTSYVEQHAEDSVDNYGQTDRPSDHVRPGVDNYQNGIDTPTDEDDLGDLNILPHLVFRI